MRKISGVNIRFRSQLAGRYCSDRFFLGTHMGTVFLSIFQEGNTISTHPLCGLPNPASQKDFALFRSAPSPLCLDSAPLQTSKTLPPPPGETCHEDWPAPQAPTTQPSRKPPHPASHKMRRASPVTFSAPLPHTQLRVRRLYTMPWQAWSRSLRSPRG